MAEIIRGSDGRRSKVRWVDPADTDPKRFFTRQLPTEEKAQLYKELVEKHKNKLPPVKVLRQHGLLKHQNDDPKHDDTSEWVAATSEYTFREKTPLTPEQEEKRAAAFANAWMILESGGSNKIRELRAAGTRPEKGPLEANLPGTPKTAKAALEEYEENRAKRLSELKPWARQSHSLSGYPPPDEVYRWKIKLDCGCVTECWTHSFERTPDKITWGGSYDKRNPGDYPCDKHGYKDREEQYRKIEGWISREIQKGKPSSESKPEVWSDEHWAEFRRMEEEDKAYWKVTLECNHTGHVFTAVDYDPDDGFQPTVTDPAEIERRKERMLEIRDEIGEAQFAHQMRNIEAGSPKPSPETTCWNCQSLRKIVAYQPIGWLIPPPRPQKKAAAKAQPVKRPPSRRELERRIAELEAENARLKGD